MSSRVGGAGSLPNEDRENGCDGAGEAAHIVYLVDDDARVCEAIIDMLRSTGHHCVSLGSIADFVAFPHADIPSCIVLDVDLPGVSGLDFQAQSAGHDYPPIIFITGHGDIPSSVLAMKRGAVDFLTKPFRDADLVAAVSVGLDRDQQRRSKLRELNTLRSRFATLTPREQEALPLIVSGLMNKQAAAELGITEVTLQIHRRQIMQKMQASSLADLVRIATQLDVPVTHSRRMGATTR